MALPLAFTRELLESAPPWLTRLVGARFLSALGAVLDDLATRAARAVRARFPSANDTDALARIGRERRIRRGPSEDAETYAARLRPWWDAHRGRGGPYELLRQLHAYFRTLHPGTRIDVVYHSGTRRWMDTDGVITRDSIAWSADGSSVWAQVWVFLHLVSEPMVELPLITDTGETLVTDGGEPLVAVLTMTDAGGLPDAQAEIYRAIPREWSAAHVQRTHVVLLHGDAALVGYPRRLVGEPGQTVGRTSRPVILTIEDGA